MKEGWREKVVNFHLNGLAHSQFIRYQIRTFCSLINKDGTQIKIKYNVSFLKPYWDSDERKVTWDEDLPPSAIDKQVYDAEKVDLLSLTNKQILIKERIDNYAITNLPS